jgi:ribonuclease HI
VTAVLRFDGGTQQANPGQKYGSYSFSTETDILSRGFKITDTRTLARGLKIPFGFGTNNEAEFDALELGLKDSLEVLRENNINPALVLLEIRTDSMIVRNRMMGKNVIHKTPKWQASSKRMFELASRCLKLCQAFKGFEVKWVGREANVAEFGH